MFRKKIGIVLGLAVFILGELWLIEKIGYVKVFSPEFNMNSQISTFKDGKITGDGKNAGFLVYGPYVGLTQGKYTLLYRLTLNDAAADGGRKIGYCDVSVANNSAYNTFREVAVKDFRPQRILVINDSQAPGNSILTVQKVKQASIKMTFKIPQGLPQTEFRFFLYAGNNVTIDGIYFRPHNLVALISILKNNVLKVNLIICGLALLLVAVWQIRRVSRQQTPVVTAEEYKLPLPFIIQLAVVAFFSLLMFNTALLEMVKVRLLPITLAGVALAEIGLFIFLLRKKSCPHLDGSLADLSLFTLVFGFIGYVLLKPTLPTLMPINFSTDGVYHFSCIDYIYRYLRIAGSGVSDYPYGYHLVTAMLARFTGIAAIKMMQLILIFSVALTTAITYAITCRIFDFKRDGRLLALLIVGLVFWVRGYYELSFNAFFHAPMVFSYLFLLSFVWGLIEYRKQRHWLTFTAINMAVIGLLYTYTSYMPLVVAPVLITVFVRADIPLRRKIIDTIWMLSIPLILMIIKVKSGSVTKIGLEVLNHEGWCIPFRFTDFGDFGEHKIGGLFLVLSLVGMSLFLVSREVNVPFVSFSLAVLCYFGILYALKYYYNIFSYYQANKILYCTPYIGVVFIAAYAQALRRQIIEKYQQYRGTRIHTIMGGIWTILLLWLIVVIVKIESYKPNYLEMIREPVYLIMDWARNNVKEPFTCLYHQNMVGHWMRGGFLYDIPSGLDKDQYYIQVIVGPLPTFDAWLKKAKTGEIAVTDDLNTPPLTDGQKQQFEILYQKENSAVVRKK